MKQEAEIVFIPWRFHLLIFIVALIVAGLIVRLIDLAVFEKNFLQSQGDARAKRIVTLPAYRGMITDRQGYPLAISASVYSVWMNPQVIDKNSQDIKTLGRLLNLSSSTLKSLITRYKVTPREFVYLKRDIPPQAAKKIKSLKMPGVFLDHDYKRFYPEGEVAAHIIGFTNIDDKGQEGIELAQDQWLRGTPGKEMVIKDRLGRVISNVQNLKEKKPGNDLALSIHHQLQFLAYRELLAGVQANLAESGSVVVLDVKTGEVLAMVNQPSFNPNNRSNESSASFRNRAVTDVFEPGSTIKAFSIASALDSGLFKPSTIIDTYPGWIRVGRNVVRDEHNTKKLTVAQVLQLSSNVGVAKIILAIPSTHLWSMLHRMGFGEETGVGFPGERSGELINKEKWAPFTLATLAFGYGLTVTPLQLAAAYSVIANHGVKMPVSLLKLNKLPAGEQVMKPKIANQMLELLESVVAEKDGTGKAARISGYRVAGKTGTARMAGAHGYEKDHHISSFVGIAPVSDPRFVVAVVIIDPKGKNYLASAVSAPVFKKVMEGALHLLNVAPDVETPAI